MTSSILPGRRFFALTAFLLCWCGFALPRTDGGEKPALSKESKLQVIGLFCPEREKDLRDLFKEKLPDIKLVSIDYPKAEITVRYDPAKVFGKANAEKIAERFDQLLRDASVSTFGAKPLRTIPADKLKLHEIAVVGLDCKGCSYGAYLMVYKLPGVEVATANFKTGKVTALVDPEKIDRAALEAALKKGGVQIRLSNAP